MMPPNMRLHCKLNGYPVDCELEWTIRQVYGQGRFLSFLGESGVAIMPTAQPTAAVTMGNSHGHSHGHQRGHAHTHGHQQRHGHITDRPPSVSNRSSVARVVRRVRTGAVDLRTGRQVANNVSLGERTCSHVRAAQELDRSDLTRSGTDILVRSRASVSPSPKWLG